ncbi:hypothetical protein OESDEN_23378, partial [Oesophagostomum dentatum]
MAAILESFIMNNTNFTRLETFYGRIFTGTRPLVNSPGAELTCSPSVPDSCPGGALCYTDALTNVKRCCESDPGQGCPSGSRVLLTSQEKPQLSAPGRADAVCPRRALCQWSHLIAESE